MNFSFRKRIVSLVLLCLLSCTAVAAAALWYQSRVADQAMDAGTKNLRLLSSLSEIKVLFGHEVQEWKNTLLRGADASAREKHAGAFDKAAASIQEKAKRLRGELNPKEATLLDQFVEAQAELVVTYTDARNQHVSQNFRSGRCRQSGERKRS